MRPLHKTTITLIGSKVTTFKQIKGIYKVSQKESLEAYISRIQTTAKISEIITGIELFIKYEKYEIYVVMT